MSVGRESRNFSPRARASPPSANSPPSRPLRRTTPVPSTASLRGLHAKLDFPRARVDNSLLRGRAASAKHPRPESRLRRPHRGHPPLLKPRSLLTDLLASARVPCPRSNAPAPQNPRAQALDSLRSRLPPLVQPLRRVSSTTSSPQAETRSPVVITTNLPSSMGPFSKPASLPLSSTRFVPHCHVIDPRRRLLAPENLSPPAQEAK